MAPPRWSDYEQEDSWGVGGAAGWLAAAFAPATRSRRCPSSSSGLRRVPILRRQGTLPPMRRIAPLGAAPRRLRRPRAPKTPCPPMTWTRRGRVAGGLEHRRLEAASRRGRLRSETHTHISLSGLCWAPMPADPRRLDHIARVHPGYHGRVARLSMPPPCAVPQASQRRLELGVGLAGVSRGRSPARPESGSARSG